MATSNGKNDDTAEEESYPYQMVKFCTKNKRGEAEIDCVPSTWITYNPTTGKCKCKYLPPPYNDDDFDLLHGYVRKQAPPPESWPLYPVTLCGHAKTYDESTKRLEILRLEDYAYTTDEKNSKADKAAAATKTYRAKKLKSDAELTGKLLRVPKIRTKIGDDRSTKASRKSNVSSNESSTDESQDENENYKMIQDSNQKGARKNAAEDTNKPDNYEFLQDQDYMTESPKKSLKSSGQKPVSQQPARRLPTLCETRGSESSILSGRSSEASDLSRSSSMPTKNNDVSDSPPRSKKGTDSSLSPASSSSVATNSNGKRTQLPATSPAGTKKETENHSSQLWMHYASTLKI